MPARLRILTVLVAFVVAVGACGVDLDATPQARTDTTTGPETGAGGGGGRPDYEAALSEWGNCEGDLEEVECAYLTVPLDWADPDGETIDLRVGRKPAEGGDRIGSLVLNPGGPGQPGVPFLDTFIAGDSVPTGLDERFDLVSWDPRGTGESSPIACSTAEELEEPGLDSAPDTPEEEEDLVEHIEESVEECVEEYPELIDEVGTRNTVRDLDALRDALGDTDLTYLGYSYGTLIGQEYLAAFPENVRAMVLDGLVLAGLSPVEQSRGQLESFEANLHAFLEWCDDQRRCFGDGDPEGALRDLFAEMEDGLRIPGDYQFTGPPREGTVGIEELAYGILVALYSENSWGVLQQALTAAMAEDPDGGILLYLRDTYRGRQEDGTWDASSDAFAAIGCADQVERAQTPLGDRERVEEWGEEYPFFGELFASGLPGCFGFPAAEEPIVPLALGSITGVPPVVLVSSTGDPATPYENGEKVQDIIDGSVVVTWEGNDHTAYRNQSKCIDAPLTRYLIELTPPEEGLRCEP